MVPVEKIFFELAFWGLVGAARGMKRKVARVPHPAGIVVDNRKVPRSHGEATGRLIAPAIHPSLLKIPSGAFLG